MFKKTLLTFVALAAALHLSAAPVDVSTAKTKAEQYLASKVYAGKYMAPGATQTTLLKTEMGDVAKTPVYYIFNTASTFVIVSGDDRAEEILAYGDRPLNLDRIPKNMEAWLNIYKEQLDWLLSHPDAKVSKPTTYKSPKVRATTYGPLLTALWDQEAPYNNLCKFNYNGTTYSCYTGCPATSASMVLYYWKYPTEPVGPLDSYTSSLELSYYNSVNFTYPALPQTTFDWDNMKDKYGTWYDENGTSHYEAYSTTEGNAVATLMRYVGQAEHMMYGTAAAGGSGIYTTDAQIVADMFIGFGYDAETTRLVHKSSYSEANWAALLQEEMAEGRPVVFMAVDNSAGGHAFNVDGYDSSINKYHINFGWSGDGNSWCAMNAFSDGGGYTFNSDQQMVIGIQPASGEIKATPSEVSFKGFAGETYTQTVKVKARNLESNIVIEKSGDNCYSVSHTTITPEEATNGVDVVVTYAPTQAGNTQATLTLSCADEDVESVTVPITGEALPRVPTLLVEPTALDFNAILNKTLTQTVSLTAAFLTHNVTITLNDDHGVFTVSPTSIPLSNTGANTPLNIQVSFNSASEGTFTGSITIESEGAESKTVNLTATARKGGNATDPYLNIASYETIDEAGASVTGMNTIYKYTEYEDQQCAWLTVANYGAMKAAATQNWTSCESLTDYSNTWNATDIFPGNSVYFSNNQGRSIYGSATQKFYVTNCSQVKALVKGGSYSSSSSASLKIYECTLNADGSITPSNTAIDSKQGSNGVITSSALDESKIYMVALTGGGSYPDLLEIGFQTPLSSIDAPFATAATEVNANGFTANWTESTNAASYTLRVAPKPAATLLMTETFAKCTANGGQDIGSLLNNYLDNAGWTGNKVYTAVGGVRLGTGSATGYITSPALDLTADNKMSVKFKALTLNTDTNCDLKISCGDATETITVPDNNEAEYTVVLDCTPTDQKVKFETAAKNKRVIITEVEFYSGDVTRPAPAKGSDEIIISGLTDLNYKVTGLLPGAVYVYDVKAVNGDDQSKWSNKIEVTTLAGMPGDANNDGKVDVNDVTTVINYILKKNPDPFNLDNANVNGDDAVDVMDVTAIINLILTSN